MKTIGLVILGAVIGAFVAGFVSPGVAHESGPEFKGVRYSNPSWERYDMSVGITTSGIPLAPRRLQHGVQQLNLPDYFGQCIAVTAHGNSDVLWFKDGDGNLRSAIIPAAANTIYRVDMMPVDNVEIRQKPN